MEGTIKMNKKTILGLVLITISIISLLLNCTDTQVKPPVPEPEFACIIDNLTVTVIDQSQNAVGLCRWWDFGDSVSTVMTSSTEPFSYTYQESGIYNIRLNIHIADTTTIIVSKVKEVQIIHEVIENQPPSGNFVYVALNDIKTVHFFDQSFDVDGYILNRLWDFGDGITSTEKNPVHIYTNFDTYTTTLTIADDALGITAVSKEIILTEPTPASTAYKYNQMPNKTTLEAVWNKNTEPDMMLYILKSTDEFGIPDVEVIHPDTITDVITENIITRDSRLGFFVIAMDSSLNLSIPSDSAYGILSMNEGIRGDLNYDNQFDDYDFETMKAFINEGLYLPSLDLNADGIIDGTDIELIIKE